MKNKSLFKQALLTSSLLLSNNSFSYDLLANNVTMPSGVFSVTEADQTKTKFVTDHIHGICAIDEDNKSFYKLDSTGKKIVPGASVPDPNAVLNPITNTPLLDCIKPDGLVAPSKPVSVTKGNDTFIFLLDLASPSSGGLWRLKYNPASGWDNCSLTSIYEFKDANSKSLRPSSLAYDNSDNLYIGTTQVTTIYKMSNATTFTRAANCSKPSLSVTARATTVSTAKGPTALEVIGSTLYILEDGLMSKVNLNTAQATRVVRGVTTLTPTRATRSITTAAGPVGMTQYGNNLYYATFDSIYKYNGTTAPISICDNKLVDPALKCFSINYDQFTTAYNTVSGLRPELGFKQINGDISLTIVSLDMIDGNLIVGDDDLQDLYGGQGMGHVWSIPLQ